MPLTKLGKLDQDFGMADRDWEDTTQLYFRLTRPASFQQAGELQRRLHILRVKSHSLLKGDLSRLAIPQAKAQIGHEAKGFPLAKECHCIVWRGCEQPFKRYQGLLRTSGGMLSIG